MPSPPPRRRRSLLVTGLAVAGYILLPESATPAGDPGLPTRLQAGHFGALLRHSPILRPLDQWNSILPTGIAEIPEAPVGASFNRDTRESDVESNR